MQFKTNQQYYHLPATKDSQHNHSSGYHMVTVLCGNYMTLIITQSTQMLLYSQQRDKTKQESHAVTRESRDVVRFAYTQ